MVSPTGVAHDPLSGNTFFMEVDAAENVSSLFLYHEEDKNVSLVFNRTFDNIREGPLGSKSSPFSWCVLFRESNAKPFAHRQNFRSSPWTGSWGIFTWALRMTDVSGCATPDSRSFAPKFWATGFVTMFMDWPFMLREGKGNSSCAAVPG